MKGRKGSKDTDNSFGHISTGDNYWVSKSNSSVCFFYLVINLWAVGEFFPKMRFEHKITVKIMRM
jgi:hypothetical protein